MKIDVIATSVLAFALLPALAHAERPASDHWLPLVKGAVYHYTGTFEEKPYDSRVQVQGTLDPGPAGAAILVELNADWRKSGHRIAARRPLLNQVWETADGIYTVIDPGDRHARIVALPPKVGARTEVNALLVEAEMNDPKTKFAVEEFEDLETPAGRYPHCLKLRYQAGAVDGHVWFARGTGIVKWANQRGHAELASYAPSPVASKREIDGQVARCNAKDDAACVEVGSALLIGTFADTGQSVRKDPRRGLALLKPACERGSGGACGAIGQYQLQERTDSREAEKWFRRGCDLGDKPSCASTPDGARTETRASVRQEVRGSLNIFRVLGKGTAGDGGGTAGKAPAQARH